MKKLSGLRRDGTGGLKQWHLKPERIDRAGRLIYLKRRGGLLLRFEQPKESGLCRRGRLAGLYHRQLRHIHASTLSCIWTQMNGEGWENR